MAYKLARRYLRQRGESLANLSESRRKGEHHVSFAAYTEALEAALLRGPKHYAQVNGWSPGFVAKLLGISRQAVHNAIDHGTLRAFYIHDDAGEVTSIIISEASVRAYAAKNGRSIAA
jgi:hypothetical protein